MDGSILVKSPEIVVKSASLPTSIVPLIFSSNEAYAAFIVYVLRASSSVRSSSGKLLRDVAAHSPRRGLIGSTGESEPEMTMISSCMSDLKGYTQRALFSPTRSVIQKSDTTKCG